MDEIRIGTRVIDTSGRSERETQISLQYDGRIPDSARDWARYGSAHAAALVNADIAVKNARRRVRDGADTVRRWQATDRYAPDVRDEQIVSTKKDLCQTIDYYRRCQVHLHACEAAYDAFIASKNATGV